MASFSPNFFFRLLVKMHRIGLNPSPSASFTAFPGFKTDSRRWNDMTGTNDTSKPSKSKLYCGNTGANELEPSKYSWPLYWTRYLGVIAYASDYQPKSYRNDPDQQAQRNEAIEQELKLRPLEPDTSGLTELMERVGNGPTASTTRSKEICSNLTTLHWTGHYIDEWRRRFMQDPFDANHIIELLSRAHIADANIEGLCASQHQPAWESDAQGVSQEELTQIVRETVDRMSYTVLRSLGIGHSMKVRDVQLGEKISTDLRVAAMGLASCQFFATSCSDSADF